MKKKNFAELIRKKRGEMTQHEYAKTIGVSWITIWRWENGVSIPKPDAIEYWIQKITQPLSNKGDKNDWL